MLSTLDPTLPMFKKDYTPPPRPTKTATMSKVELPIDFLKDLPLSHKKVKSRRLKLISKGKSEGKYQRYKLLKEKFGKEMIKEKNRLDVMKHAQQARLDPMPPSVNTPSNARSQSPPAGQPRVTVRSTVGQPARGGLGSFTGLNQGDHQMVNASGSSNALNVSQLQP